MLYFRRNKENGIKAHNEGPEFKHYRTDTYKHQTVRNDSTSQTLTEQSFVSDMAVTVTVMIQKST